MNAAQSAEISAAPTAPSGRRSQRPFAGMWVTGMGTLASRVLGLLRDLATASLLGMSGSGVLDAFVVAMRVPNFFRRLVGEGALSAGYVPVLARAAEHGRRDAWKLVSVVLLWLGVAAALVVVVGEVLCLAVWQLAPPGSDAALLAKLTATMLPFVLFICLCAHLSSTLHVYGHFTLPALSPALLNIAMLVAAWGIAPSFAPEKHTQALILAASVAAAGVFQFMLLWGSLRRLEFRWDYDWSAARAGFWQTAWATLPMVLGLGVTQINTLLDNLVAWSLTAPTTGERTIAWLGADWQYPLTAGAASAIYYGERLYQFPVGMLGIAVATVIFPLLARHAARGEYERISEDLTAGLRLVMFLGLPASAGLVLLAEPISRLLLERGEFTAEDAARTARLIACYGAGAWAYCGLPVIVRGFYAVDDRRTPLRLGMLIVVVDFISNVALVWPLAELGLAVGTTVTALAQLCVLTYLFTRFHRPLAWAPMFATLGRALAGCLVMGLVVQSLLVRLPNAPGAMSQALRMGLPALAGGVVFLAFNQLLGGHELRLLARPRF